MKGKPTGGVGVWGTDVEGPHLTGIVKQGDIYHRSSLFHKKVKGKERV